MSFQIHALPPEPFAALFQMTEAQLKAHGARRETVTKCPDIPCRISLADAAIGESVILTGYTHQTAHSPYRASHAIYLRENVAQAQPAPGEVPVLFHHRVMSLRLFDAAGYMIAAQTCPGTELAETIPALLENANGTELHLHFAAPGCFAARVTRASATP